MSVLAPSDPILPSIFLTGDEHTLHTYCISASTATCGTQCRTRYMRPFCCRAPHDNSRPGCACVRVRARVRVEGAVAQTAAREAPCADRLGVDKPQQLEVGLEHRNLPTRTPRARGRRHGDGCSRVTDRGNTLSTGAVAVVCRTPCTRNGCATLTPPNQPNGRLVTHRW